MEMSQPRYGDHGNNRRRMFVAETVNITDVLALRCTKLKYTHISYNSKWRDAKTQVQSVHSSRHCSFSKLTSSSNNKKCIRNLLAVFILIPYANSYLNSSYTTFLPLV